MASSKAVMAEQESTRHLDEFSQAPPPSYDDAQADASHARPTAAPRGPSDIPQVIVPQESSSAATGASPSLSPSASASASASTSTLATNSGPSRTHPFAFPKLSSSSATKNPSHSKVMAIPQVQPSSTAPFLRAYPKCLAQYGVHGDNFYSFADTLSAFLAGQMPQSTVNKAAAIGNRSLQNVPRRFGKGVADHASSLGRNIQREARKGNYFGAAVGAFVGAISLPISTVMRAVGTVISLPGAAANSFRDKPQTPRERAAAYVAAADGEWLYKRSLAATLCSTSELASTVGVDVSVLTGGGGAGKDPRGKMAAFSQYFEEVELEDASELEIGPDTLWLVIM